MKRPVIRVYRDQRRQWRWRLVAANNRIIADGGEGYKTSSGARRAIIRVRLAFLAAAEEGNTNARHTT